VSTVIKLKRGTATPTTSNIISGEVAIDTNAQKFYINDGGSIKEIGGAASSALTVQDEGSALSTGATTLNFVGTGVVASGTGATKTITISAGTADLTSISTDLTPDTHNAYDVGQLGSAFRDFTFVRKLQKNVEIFTRATGLGSVATSLGFNINTSVANMTEVYTAAGGLGSPVLGGASAAFDDSNPAFLF